MSVTTEPRLYKSIPDTVHSRLKILKAALDADNIAAVIGMGLARLEDGFGCTSCGCWVGRNPEQPPPIDSARWDDLAQYHTADCRWIRTKGYQVKIKGIRGKRQ